MSHIEVYSFEDRDGNEFGSFTTTDPNEARHYAREHNLRVIANIYEFSERVVAEDFTAAKGNDSD